MTDFQLDSNINRAYINFVRFQFENSILIYRYFSMYYLTEKCTLFEIHVHDDDIRTQRKVLSVGSGYRHHEHVFLSVYMEHIETNIKHC